MFESSAMTIDSQNMILLVKKGDLKGFRQLFDNYYAMLCGISNGYLNNKQLSEEVVGDVFLKIWENRTDLDIHSSIKAYLMKAVRNRSLNYLEKQKNERYFKTNLSGDLCREEILLSDYQTPLSGMITDELENAINKAIDALPPDCREIFRMSRFENLKYHEIARLQNISVNTVKTQMKIALHKLRQALSPQMFLLVVARKSILH